MRTLRSAAATLEEQVRLERELCSPRGPGTTALATTPVKGAHAANGELVRRNRALEEQFAALQREHRELRKALFGAADAQRKLYAPRELRRGPWEIASEIFPVRYISGDFYDVLDLGAATGLVVGDIAGKGLAAGLWSTHLLGLVRMHSGSIREPAATVTAINRQLWQFPSGPPMTSLFLGRLDAWSGELLYCNAGQPSALLLRQGGTVESLREGGAILGAIPDASFVTGRTAMEQGDTLVAFSDGIVECRNEQGEEFGAERLLAAARSAQRSAPGTVLFSILGAVQDFIGRQPRHDDFTLMVVRRLEK